MKEGNEMKRKAETERQKRLGGLVSAVVTEMNNSGCSSKEAIEIVACAKELNSCWILILCSEMHDRLKVH